MNLFPLISRHKFLYDATGGRLIFMPAGHSMIGHIKQQPKPVKKLHIRQWMPVTGVLLSRVGVVRRVRVCCLHNCSNARLGQKPYEKRKWVFIQPALNDWCKVDAAWWRVLDYWRVQECLHGLRWWVFCGNCLKHFHWYFLASFCSGRLIIGFSFIEKYLSLSLAFGRCCVAICCCCC